MTTLLKGKPVADKIDLSTKEKVEKLVSSGVTPTLAILRVGEKPDDLAYERSAMKKCATLNISVRNVVLEETVSQDEFLSQLQSLNDDPSVNGILMLQPLPKHIDSKRAVELLNPLKDVDGCTATSQASTFANSNNGFTPCTAQAVMEILDFYNIEVSGKNVVVIGRSLVIGKPVSMLLLNKNATVTICHSKTVNLQSVSKKADIVVCAIGKMESLTADYFSENQVIIDVGINFNEEKGKLCGDVDFDNVCDKASFITPVPRGVGSVTTSIMLSHVVESCERMNNAN